MGRTAKRALERWQRLSRNALCRAEVLALFPILVLCAHALGHPTLVVAIAMVLPSLLLVQTLGTRRDHPRRERAFAPQGVTTAADRATMIAMLDRISSMTDMETACFILQIDDWDRLERQLGRDTSRDVIDECDRRLRAALRADDLVAHLGTARFGVVLHPIAGARLAIRDAIADRLCAGLAAPIAVGGTVLRLTAAVGHAALWRTGDDNAEATFSAANRALEEARAAGPGSVRSFASSTFEPRLGASSLAREVPDALVSGAIVPWFQPQIDAQTGQVVGFEALARWQHPDLGVLKPLQFMSAVEAAGRMEELGTVIRRKALHALGQWDRRGPARLSVSVNACSVELRSPTYAEHVAWDVDAAGIAPQRLIVEVLESVAVDAGDDAILATLASLRSQGIGLDLDDFGVGQASLMSIRRFGVGRIKIDRSFINGIDTDTELQSMVAGIVSLGKSMGLEAVAEGIETPQQQAVLARLGCAQMQGFGIAEPMPLTETYSWLASRTPWQVAQARQTAAD